MRNNEPKGARLAKPTFGSAFASLGVPLGPSGASARVAGVPQYLHGRVEVLLSEVALEDNT